jgi:L-arabinose transport system substrate-binding protein
MILKRLLSAAVMVCAGVMLSACGSGDSSPTASSGGSTTAPSAGNEPVKIGFIVKQPEAQWFQLEWRFADQAAKDHNFELIKIGAADGEKVLAAIDNLAASGAQGFVICTPDTKLGPAIVNKAESRGLKVLAVDDQFEQPDGKPMTDVPYVGISAKKIGISVGEALAAEMKKRGWTNEGTGVCVVTWDELETQRARTDGAVEALKAAGFPEAQIYKAPQKTNDQPGALNSTNILLTQQGGVKRWLVCGPNDDAVLGAVRAMEGRGFTADNVIGIGINGTECIPEFEKSERTGFFASSLLQAKEHGYKTAEMMYKWIKEGAEPAKDTRTIGVMITKDNFQQVLKEQGIR